MAGQDAGRVVINGNDWARNIEKRLLHEGRRPQITTASDIMGPGLAPFAVELFDWNADEAIFNGFWFSTPGCLNAPQAARYYTGYTVGNEDGYGTQIVTEYREQDGHPTSEWESNRFVRRFYTPVAGVHRSYSGWRQLNEAGPAGEDGDTGPVGPAGSPGYRHAQVSPSASWVVTHGLGKVPAVVIVLDGIGRVMADVTDIDDNNLNIVFPSAVTGIAEMC